MKSFYSMIQFATRSSGANAVCAVALILAVALGCANLRKRQQNQSNQPLQVFREQKTSGLITSADTGGMCVKKTNGQMVRSSQVGFSYSVEGKNYTSVGCTYNPQTTVGSKVTLCYNPSSPATAKPCSD